MRENKKSAKIDFPSRGKIKNQRKSTFRHGGKQEISENLLSATGENQKSAKIGFPNIGKTKNRRKSAFRHGGKQEISENRLFAAGENQKSAKNGFPNIGKTKNWRKTAFPILGRIKNAIGCISQLLERRETPESLLSDFRGSVHFDTSSYRVI